MNEETTTTRTPVSAMATAARLADAMARADAAIDASYGHITALMSALYDARKALGDASDNEQWPLVVDAYEIGETVRRLEISIACHGVAVHSARRDTAAHARLIAGTYFQRDESAS